MLDVVSIEVIVRIGLIILVAVVLSIVYSMAIRRLLQRNAGKKKSQTIYKLLLNMGRYVTWFIAALIILETLNVQTAPILASAGVLGIAVGFGAQSIVMDMIAGFFILFEETFLVGEVIEVQGFRGEVMEIGLRTTKIKSWDGTLKVFSNGEIKAVSNFSRFSSVAQVEFQVSYETNLATLSKVLEPFLTAYTHEQVIEPPTFIGVTNLSDSGITCMITCACKPNSHFGVTRDIRAKLKTHLDESGIQIPYRLSMVKEKSSS